MHKTQWKIYILVCPHSSELTFDSLPSTLAYCDEVVRFVRRGCRISWIIAAVRNTWVQPQCIVANTMSLSSNIHRCTFNAHARFRSRHRFDSILLDLEVLHYHTIPYNNSDEVTCESNNCTTFPLPSISSYIINVRPE